MPRLERLLREDDDLCDDELLCALCFAESALSCTLRELCDVPCACVPGCRFWCFDEVSWCPGCGECPLLLPARLAKNSLFSSSSLDLWSAWNPLSPNAATR